MPERRVGWCAACGHPILLRLQNGCREARCHCPEPAIPARFFATAMRTGPLTRVTEPVRIPHEWTHP